MLLSPEQPDLVLNLDPHRPYSSITDSSRLTGGFNSHHCAVTPDQNIDLGYIKTDKNVNIDNNNNNPGCYDIGVDQDTDDETIPGHT